MGSFDAAERALVSVWVPTQESATDDPVVIDIRGGDVAIDLGIDTTERTPTLLLPGVGLLGATRFQLRLKRAVDILVSSVALVVLSPVFLAIAMAVKVTSQGPLFYKCPRIGIGGEPFVFVKFRTMYVGADCRKTELLEHNEASGPIFKMKDDPRITPVGRFLRKTSLDEIPQLAHVLSGKMSLVGVRPHLPEEVAAYSDVERQRLLVKPGLTCIWQVSGRSDLDFDTWIQMDLTYVATWTMALDIKLMWRTIGAVVSGRGAY